MAGRILSVLSQQLTPYLVYLLLVATLGPLLFGFHLAELNAPSDVLTCTKTTSKQYLASSPLSTCIPMSTFEFGLTSSMFTIGGLVGALSVGYPAGVFGRLKAMRYTTVSFILGSLAEALAPNVPVIVIGRFISGLGAGAAITVVPIYVSEIAPPKSRGLFGAFTQIQVNTGILITQILGLFLSKGKLWRLILGVGGMIALLQAVGLLFVVESPTWTADHGNPARARKDLQKIRGPSQSIVEETSEWGSQGEAENEGADEALLGAGVVSDSEAGSTSQRQQPRQTIGYFTALMHPQYRRATWYVMVVMVAQQFTGINSIIMYGVKVLSTLLPTSSALLNVFIALMNLTVTATCAPLSDRLGRKTCLIASITGMGLSSLLLGIAILNNIAAMSAVAVLTFVGSFGIGLGPIPFILASELVGPEAVGATQSWALAANWISTFAVAQFFPVLNEAMGHGKMYFVFAALAALFATFIAIFLPESKGKADADEVWGRQKHSLNDARQSSD